MFLLPLDWHINSVSEANGKRLVVRMHYSSERDPLFIGKKNLQDSNLHSLVLEHTIGREVSKDLF